MGILEGTIIAGWIIFMFEIWLSTPSDEEIRRHTVKTVLDCQVMMDDLKRGRLY
jgi:hypothetical protein